MLRLSQWKSLWHGDAVGGLALQRPQERRLAAGERFSLWRVALVADGTGRPRSDFLYAARQRNCLPRHGRRREEKSGRRQSLFQLPWRNGTAATGARSSSAIQARRRL